MAVEFEQITALIDANTTRWENKLNKMSTSFDKKAAAIEKRNDAMVAKMNSGWAKFGGGLNGVTAKLAGIFSTAAVVGFAKSILDTGDALQDASAQLGVTSQQLQALDYAARVSGFERRAQVGGVKRPTRCAGGHRHGSGQQRAASDRYSEMGNAIRHEESFGSLPIRPSVAHFRLLPAQRKPVTAPPRPRKLRRTPEIARDHSAIQQ